MGTHMQKEPKRGPNPDTVKIDMDWEKAVGKALKKERPKDGWPEESKKAKKEKGGR